VLEEDFGVDKKSRHNMKSRNSINYSGNSPAECVDDNGRRMDPAEHRSSGGSRSSSSMPSWAITAPYTH